MSIVRTASLTDKVCQNSMMHISYRFAGPLVGGLLVLTTVALSGCTTLKLPRHPFSASPSSSPAEHFAVDPGVASLGESEPQQVYQAIQQARAQNAIVLHVPGQEPPVRVLPLPEQGNHVYVSNLLQDTGVLQKLGTVEATLYRHTADSFTGTPMECRMSADGQAVRPESDYALQPGDRLRVTEAAGPGGVRALINMALQR